MNAFGKDLVRSTSSFDNEKSIVLIRFTILLTCILVGLPSLNCKYKDDHTKQTTADIALSIGNAYKNTSIPPKLLPASAIDTAIA